MTVFDTTLRDGEQTPGVSFRQDHKFAIARQLSECGVHAIEAGFPASSPAEFESVKAIAAMGLEADICGLARMLKADVDACLDAGVDLVHVFIPTSEIQRTHTIKKSPEEVVATTREVVGYVREHVDSCMFSAMDATRTELPFLIEVSRAAAEAGATIVNVPDTVGVYTPTKMLELIGALVPEVSAPLDVHCHNDFGLAVANTIAAVEAGAAQVQVTVNGLGERAGNADLAQTVMVLESILGVSTGVETKRLVETSRLVSRYSGIAISPVQPVVGENAFSHESGIHSHGVMANAATFEPGIMTPEMVGHRRRLTLGKHVGRHAVRQMLADVQLEPTDAELDRIVEKVKAIANRGKRVTDADLYEIAETVLGPRGRRPADRPPRHRDHDRDPRHPDRVRPGDRRRRRADRGLHRERPGRRGPQGHREDRAPAGHAQGVRDRGDLGRLRRDRARHDRGRGRAGPDLRRVLVGRRRGARVGRGDGERDQPAQPGRGEVRKSIQVAESEGPPGPRPRAPA